MLPGIWHGAHQYLYPQFFPGGFELCERSSDAGERVDELDGVVFADSWDAEAWGDPDEEAPAPPSAPTRAEAGTQSRTDTDESADNEKDSPT